MPHWRPIRKTDREEYLAMARTFFDSDAVMHPIPLSHIEATFAELMRSDTYAQAFICEADGDPAGYALLAKTFSQEAGGTVLWVEELFIKPPFRGKGFCRAFFEQLLSSLSPGIKRIRLETEHTNTRAVTLYRSLGFDFLEYDQMVLER